MGKMKAEDKLRIAACKEISLKYPKVIFWCDGSGDNAKPMQRRINAQTRSERGVPDLFIPEPRGKYSGLFLELKAEGARLYLKDGVTLAKSDHLDDQKRMLDKLSDRGFCAMFSQGIDDTMQKVDWYLSLQSR